MLDSYTVMLNVVTMSIVMLSVLMFTVIKLSVIMLSAVNVTLIVVAPLTRLPGWCAGSETEKKAVGVS
jgi:hypothetical protein